MMRQFVQITLLTGTLIMGFVPFTLAVSRGVVATVTAVDDKTSMVTLQTETGQVFQLTKDDLPYWQVGRRWNVSRQTTTRTHGCRIVSRGSDSGRQLSPQGRTGVLLTAGASPARRPRRRWSVPTLAQPGGTLGP